jgi:hypothetical protein
MLRHLKYDRLAGTVISISVSSPTLRAKAILACLYVVLSFYIGDFAALIAKTDCCLS